MSRRSVRAFCARRCGAERRIGQAWFHDHDGDAGSAQFQAQAYWNPGTVAVPVQRSDRPAREHERAYYQDYIHARAAMTTPQSGVAAFFARPTPTTRARRGWGVNAETGMISGWDGGDGGSGVVEVASGIQRMRETRALISSCVHAPPFAAVNKGTSKTMLSAGRLVAVSAAPLPV
jgi:hypothetical protein